MDTTSIHTFLAVAECGSFSLASERLFVTQPAVSKRISALENELKSRLFDRIGRQVSLTQAGEIFLIRGRKILLELEDSRREITNLSSQISGRLVMGTSHHIGLHRLPPILRKYTNEHADVALDIRFMGSEDACRAVQIGELEIAIVTLPTDSPIGLKTRLIWRDPLSVVIAKEYPLHRASKRGQSIPLKHLAEHPAVLPSAETYTRQIIEKVMNKNSVKITTNMSTNNLDTIKMLVSVGLGWSVLPHSIVDNKLYVLKVKQLQLVRQLGVVWHPARTLSNAANAMVNHCLNQ